MERAFEETEVYNVVRKMVKDKAPESDGFFMCFFQTCWEVIKEDLMRVFQELFSVGKFEKSFNTTFLALIPKKVGAMKVKGASFTEENGTLGKLSPYVRKTLS